MTYNARSIVGLLASLGFGWGESFDFKNPVSEASIFWVLYGQHVA